MATSDTWREYATSIAVVKKTKIKRRNTILGVDFHPCGHYIQVMAHTTHTATTTGTTQEEIMITKATSYDYPMTGQNGETVATLSDGRVVTVNTQYGVALPHGEHAADCDQLTKIGGRCNCGLLDGIDVAALVDDARANGKRGRAPVVETARKETTDTAAHGLCTKCQSYCYGDCEA